MGKKCRWWDSALRLPETGEISAKKVWTEILELWSEKVILKAKDGTNIELIYREETKTWFGKLKRGIEQDIEVSVGGKNYKFRTIPPTKMGDDLFDDWIR